MPRNSLFIAAMFCVIWFTCARTALSQTVLRNICTVQGLEEKPLQGMGLVIGLQGTGDGPDAIPTILSLARTMELMGVRLGEDVFRDLKTAKNVALVTVEATVPAMGAKRGTKIDCRVSAVSAKSLVGGRLFMTPLLGVDARNDRRVFGIARGNVELERPSVAPPTAGRIHDGCTLWIDYEPQFVKDNVVTLVLDKDHAGFQVPSDVAERINAEFYRSVSENENLDESQLAKADGPIAIRVPIPSAYLADPSRNRDADPVGFISEVLRLPIEEPQVKARVVVNKRAGTIVISGDVEIGSVVVSNGTVTVEAGAEATDRFVPIDVDGKRFTPEQKTALPTTTKLQSLIAALNAVQVSKDEMIEIIRLIAADGKLRAELVFVE